MIFYTLDELKTSMGILLTDTSRDVELTLALYAVDRLFLRYLNLTGLNDAYTDIRSARFYRQGLTIQHHPVTAITQITVDGVDEDLTEWEYQIGNPILQRYDREPYIGLLRVEYTAGFTAITDDLRLAAQVAARTIIADAADSDTTGQIKREEHGRHKQEFFESSTANGDDAALVLPAASRAILDAYRVTVIQVN